MSYTLTEVSTLTTEECCTCGVVFAMPESLRQQCLNKPGNRANNWSGKPFFCPNGHKQWYSGPSELEQQRRRNANLAESLRCQRAEAELQRRRAAAYRGHLTRYRKRIAHGVCPCCNRSFANVRQHMASVHPDVLDRVRRDEDERPSVAS